MEQYLNRLKVVNGIIQVGSSSGQEVPLFVKYTNHVILFDPIPSNADLLKRRYPNLIVLNVALGNEDKQGILHIASNAGESSSLLQPIDHLKHYPNIQFNVDFIVRIKRFSTIVAETNMDVSGYNVLITDTQGYDLEVIKGFADYVYSFDLIIAEYINTNLYEGNANLIDISNYLADRGFVLLETSNECCGAGNAIFEKKVI